MTRPATGSNPDTVTPLTDPKIAAETTPRGIASGSRRVTGC